MFPIPSSPRPAKTGKPTGKPRKGGRPTRRKGAPKSPPMPPAAGMPPMAQAFAGGGLVDAIGEQERSYLNSPYRDKESFLKSEMAKQEGNKRDALDRLANFGPSSSALDEFRRTKGDARLAQQGLIGMAGAPDVNSQARQGYMDAMRGAGEQAAISDSVKPGSGFGAVADGVEAFYGAQRKSQRPSGTSQPDEEPMRQAPPPPDTTEYDQSNPVGAPKPMKLGTSPGLTQSIGGLGGVLGEDPMRQQSLGFARGGSTDTIPAMLSPGEYVLPPKTTQAVGGAPALDQLVRATNGKEPGARLVPGFAAGGYNNPDELAKEYERQMGRAPTLPAASDEIGRARADAMFPTNPPASAKTVPALPGGPETAGSLGRIADPTTYRDAAPTIRGRPGPNTQHTAIEGRPLASRTPGERASAEDYAAMANAATPAAIPASLSAARRPADYMRRQVGSELGSNAMVHSSGGPSDQSIPARLAAYERADTAARGGVPFWAGGIPAANAGEAPAAPTAAKAPTAPPTAPSAPPQGLPDTGRELLRPIRQGEQKIGWAYQSPVGQQSGMEDGLQTGTAIPKATPAAPSSVLEIQRENSPESDALYRRQIEAAGGSVRTGKDGATEYVMPNNAPVSASDLARQVRAAGGPNQDVFKPENLSKYTKPGAFAAPKPDTYGGFDVSGMSPNEYSAFKVQALKDQGQAENDNALMRQWQALPQGQRGPMPYSVARAMTRPDGPPPSAAFAVGVEGRQQAAQAAQAQGQFDLEKERIKAGGDVQKRLRADEAKLMRMFGETDKGAPEEARMHPDQRTAAMGLAPIVAGLPLPQQVQMLRDSAKLYIPLDRAIEQVKTLHPDYDDKAIQAEAQRIVADSDIKMRRALADQIALRG